LRWGSYRAVCKSVSATETPGDELDTILFTLKFSETGLRAPPKPAPAAKAATTATQGAQVATLTAGESAAIAAAGAAVSARAAGYLVAIGNAETGLGNLPDVDASLATLAQAVADLDALHGGGGDHAVSMHRIAAIRIDARRKHDEAIRVLGPCYPLVADVLLAKGDPATWARRRGIHEKAGFGVLVISLDALAEHYAIS
jgi:hypothetical protein